MRQSMPSAPPFLSIASKADHIAWPPLHGEKSSILLTLMHRFEHFQWLSQREIMEYQYAQLLALAHFSAQASPYFRERISKANLTAADLSTPEGLRKLPPLTRLELQQHAEAIYSERVPTAHLPMSEAKSSGSTGQPVVMRKTSLNDLFWSANIMREHFWHRRDFRGKTLNVRAANTTPTLQEDWGSPVNIYFKSGQVMNVPVTYSPEQLAGIISEFQPNNLIIYPSALKALATFCEERKISITCLNHIWCVGETLYPEVRSHAEAIFGAKVEDDYSCNEIGIMALQCPESGHYHVMAETIILEILRDDGTSCEEGEVGKVVVTDLQNYATPMIRYEIGDYAEMGGTCRCGRGLPLLKRLSGRRRNLVANPDGRRYFPALAVAMFGSGLPIRQFQVIQHALDDVEAKLVTDAPLDDSQETILIRALHQSLDHPFPLRITYCEGSIPRPANGKFEEFICHV